jgi:hypothetical protein
MTVWPKNILAFDTYSSLNKGEGLMFFRHNKYANTG